MQNKRQTGSSYEKIAAAYFIQQGLEIMEYNYRNRRAEIDLIVRDHDYLVFVEVKYRSSLRHGDPAESVDVKKQARIRHAARHYLYSTQQSEDLPCRFDVISILEGEITWYKNAF